MNKEDILKLFIEKENYHASSYILYLIKEIEHDLIFTLGITTDFKLFIYSDNSNITFIATHDGNIVCEKQYKNSLSHYFTNSMYTEITIDLSCSVNDKYVLDLKEASAVFINDDKWKASDDGEIFIEGNVTLNINSMRTFLLDIFTRATRELQHCVNLAWTRNVFEDFGYQFKELNDNMIMEKQVKVFIEEFKKLYD